MAETYNEPTSGDSADPDKPYVATDEEKTQVKQWLDRVKRAEDEPKRKAWVTLLAKLRGYVYGTTHEDKTGDELTRTNMVFATIAGMIPRLYAKNPDIGVTPSPACPKEKLPAVKQFCITAEAVLSQMFVKEAKLKPRAKANVRAAMTTSFGVLKMVYQKSLHGDPLVIRRIQDTQDNLAKVELLAKNLKKADDPDKVAKQRDELNAQLQGLRSGNEIKVFKGFAIDRVRSEDFLILDDSIAEFDEYVDASALGHQVWMTSGDFETKFGFKPDGATKYNTPFYKEGQSTAEQGLGEKYVCVIEIWDKSSGAIRTVAKGLSRWCRAPYAPENTSERWYPFFVLAFNIVEGRWRPLSDVELLMALQDEYNTTRTNFADVRKRSVPLRIVRKSGNLSEEDLKAINSAKNGDTVAIEGNPSVPINSDVMQLEGLKIDPTAYDVGPIRNDMDIVSGTSDAGRANLIKPKTATEAEIMQQAMGSRVDERRDTNEDLITDMAEAALQIGMRDLSQEEVRQIAGADATWPEMSVEEIFSMVEVSVRAGSSGKPNADKEREQWTQLLPVIQTTLKTVMDLRMAGQYDMANSAIELLRETLRRFQERIDVDSLIPPLEKGADGKPVMQGQMMQQAQQQVQQLGEQVQQLQDELGQCQDALKKAQAGEQSKLMAEQTKRDAAAADAQRADAQAQAEAQRAADKAAAEERLRAQDIGRKYDYEQEKLAMEERVAKERIASAEAEAIEVARIKAGAKTPEEEQAAQASAEAITAEQEAAKQAEQQTADQRFQQTSESIMGLGQGIQTTLQNVAALAQRIEHVAGMAAQAGGEKEIVLDANGLPVGIRPKVTH